MNRIKQWWKDHDKMTKLGNAIGAAGAVIAVGGVWNFEGLKEIFTPGEIKLAITISVICGVVGKFLTELYKHDSN